MIILDRLDDSDKASMIGRLFRACIQGKYTFDIFLRLSHIVNAAFVDDIRALAKCFSPEALTYQLSEKLPDNLNGVGLTSTKLEADKHTQERYKRVVGRDAKQIPYEYRVVHSLNNDALIIAREVFDLVLIERNYHIYKQHAAV